MTCCVNDLGAYPSNKDVNTGLLATQTGVHKAILFFGGIRIERRFSGTNGAAMVIPRPFNEMYQYKLQIQQPDGTLYSHLSCTDFKFKTYIYIDLQCDNCECDEDLFLYL